jgi:acyl carrier protein
MTQQRSAVSSSEVQQWLVEKIAIRLGVPPEEVGVDTYFDDFALDSTEALVLAGELEKWLGMQLETTALWYHPTIAELAGHIAGGNAEGSDAAAR